MGNRHQNCVSSKQLWENSFYIVNEIIKNASYAKTPFAIGKMSLDDIIRIYFKNTSQDTIDKWCAELTRRLKKNNIDSHIHSVEYTTRKCKIASNYDGLDYSEIEHTCCCGYDDECDACCCCFLFCCIHCNRHHTGIRHNEILYARQLDPTLQCKTCRKLMLDYYNENKNLPLPSFI